ncbi:MAG: di-heme oxidoredictase family protein, partial [Planctomycetota bacterium]
ALSKLRPPAFDDRENYVEDDDNVFEQRQTPSVLGLGLLDTVPDAAILARQDLTDRNGDGIFGIARVVMVNGQPEIGKFGWKAQVPQLADFAQDAMAGENGITTPDDGRGFGLNADGDLVSDPELSPEDLSDLEFFLLNLGPPIRGGSTDPDVAEGEILFTTVSCAVCHVPTLPSTTGRRVKAYTNLLLHDVMGPGYLGMEEPGAPNGFFRTPPLWGIKDTAPYMHDGRAETLTDAINAHAGEAAASQLAFSLLPQSEKDKLILFLEDL